LKLKIITFFQCIHIEEIRYVTQSDDEENIFALLGAPSIKISTQIF
jgi:hypothetical protein